VADSIKCIPIRTFGRRHLDEVVPEVNTTESVANWCAVDTKTGKITVMLEENYCFDAEVYADELDLPEWMMFREDQRSMSTFLEQYIATNFIVPVNLGKWVLRNLFTTLLDEEIRRDEDYRQTLRTAPRSGGGGLSRPGAPTRIVIPDSGMGTPVLSPGGAVVTPRATNGPVLVPATPVMAIGAATPGPGSLPGTLPPTAEEDSEVDKGTAKHSQPAGGTEPSNDYFSSTAHAQSEASSESNKIQGTPGEMGGPMSMPTSPTEERRKGTIFGKKFPMTFPKMLVRTSVEVKPPVAVEEKSDSGSHKSSEKEEKIIEDNFFGVIQKIRQDYEDQLESKPDQPIATKITPSMPLETPVLKPPPHTTIIIQEDNPESGGLADQYRGEVSELGKEADTLEKIAPTWLGELLLKVRKCER